MPWFDYVKGIVHGYLGGQAGASAMMNVLTGKVCPSGKLNETYPLHYEDTPAFHYYPSKERSSEYREALYVGYRYYTTVGKKVRFPFGYGLSYTTFAYSNFSVDKDGVTFTIKNTGDVEGTEIAQLYVGKKSETIFRPVRELKGFARVTLAPGEEKSVHIAFDDKTFRFYDTRTDTWEVESGNYQIMVGTDADTMVLVGSLDIAGTVESISKITPDVLQKCYDTFYHPSNMVMVICGDFVPEEILKEVKKRLKPKQNQGEIKRIYEPEENGINKKYNEKVMEVSMPLFAVG